MEATRTGWALPDLRGRNGSPGPEVSRALAAAWAPWCGPAIRVLGAVRSFGVASASLVLRAARGVHSSSWASSSESSCSGWDRAWQAAPRRRRALGQASRFATECVERANAHAAIERRQSSVQGEKVVSRRAVLLRRAAFLRAEFDREFLVTQFGALKTLLVSKREVRSRAQRDVCSRNPKE